MTDLSLPQKKPEEKLSFPFFAGAVILQSALYLFAVRFFAPAIWERQFAHGFLSLFLSLAATVVVAYLYNCFFELFFHRYFLHMAPIAWLRNFEK